MYILYLVSVFVAFILFVIYPWRYFKSESFVSIKQGISDYISDCNDLNSHIEDLRHTYASMRKTDYGDAQFQNTSQYNYKKKGLTSTRNLPNVVECSKSVCDGARKQPFKYLCKYFNIQTDEPTLEEFEKVLNNFVAAEEGKVLSQKKREGILNDIAHDIPGFIRTFFKERLDKELGFDAFQFQSLYFPTYSFRYTSAGGNSGSQYSITLDIPMLERFVGYMGDIVKFKKSAAGQRSLMTPKLRQHIIDRDNHTCKICGNSTNKEPNLLLEVDHIVPIAKGGITSEDNLQCLCWKCNRTKGSK